MEVEELRLNKKIGSRKAYKYYLYKNLCSIYIFRKWYKKKFEISIKLEKKCYKKIFFFLNELEKYLLLLKIISKYKISNFVKNQILQNIFRFSNHFNVIRISSVFSHFCSFSYSF